MRSMLLRCCFADRQPRRRPSSVHFSWRLHSWSLFSKDYPTPRALLSQPQPLSHSTREPSSNILLVTYTYCAFVAHCPDSLVSQLSPKIRAVYQDIFVDPPEKNSLSSSPANDGTAIITTSSRYLRPLRDITTSSRSLRPHRHLQHHATTVRNRSGYHHCRLASNRSNLDFVATL
jgi:hypothetical protein